MAEIGVNRSNGLSLPCLPRHLTARSQLTDQANEGLLHLGCSALHQPLSVPYRKAFDHRLTFGLLSGDIQDGLGHCLEKGWESQAFTCDDAHCSGSESGSSGWGRMGKESQILAQLFQGLWLLGDLVLTP